jgi:hypothetical protein
MKIQLIVACVSTLFIAGMQISAGQTCCPAPTGTQVCCAGQTIDPTSTTNAAAVTFDLTSEAQAIGTATQNYGNINGNGCSWKPGQKLTASLQNITHQDCCSGVVTTLNDVTGNISFQLGSFTCSANLLSEEAPQWLASATLNLSISAAINAQNVEWKQTCDSKEVDVTLPGITIGLSGTAAFSLVGSYIELSGGIEGSGTGSVVACVAPDGSTSLKSPLATLTADLFCNVKLGGVTIAPWQLPIYPATGS